MYSLMSKADHKHESAEHSSKCYGSQEHGAFGSIKEKVLEQRERAKGTEEQIKEDPPQNLISELILKSRMWA